MSGPLELVNHVTFKTIKKIIDLNFAIEHNLDCEFSDSGDVNGWYVGKLVKIHDDSYSDGAYRWKYCRIRQSPYVHFWDRSNVCPLPVGLNVIPVFNMYGMASKPFSTYQDQISWNDVIGFEVIGPAKDWSYK